MEKLLQYINNVRPLTSLKALDTFSRAGEWATYRFASMVKTLECWEYDSQHIERLKRNFPNAIVRQVDSIQQMQQHSQRYDFVFIDNPQGLYCDNKYCEHFEILGHIHRVVTDHCFVIFNCNNKPYVNPEKPIEYYNKWIERRNIF
ncbi:hypothetical protein [Paucidesulfovibrio longus]|uniref:hypothetical protein n=1 Tax=Paucidesulfovibrio longus TaxID=889 RepID=UPI0003B491A0|nr:hypothetical protein [Paucidesulfovibrio longus]